MLAAAVEQQPSVDEQKSEPSRIAASGSVSPTRTVSCEKKLWLDAECVEFADQGTRNTRDARKLLTSSTRRHGPSVEGHDLHGG
jgi:hypothetical protein